MHKVSIVIPIYMVENYLRECLDSVVNQTLKDIEVICVDDGSTDRSAEIASEYVERYSNFKLIRIKHSGLSIARNAGMDVATGEYLYFLDSDDYLAVDALEILYREASEKYLDVLYFNVNPVFDNDQIEHDFKHLIPYYARENQYSGICSGQTMFARMRSDKKYMPSVCIQFFRREFLEYHHHRCYPGILHEDNLFSLQCAMTAKRVDYISDKLYFRRIRENSIVTAPKTIRHVEGYVVSYSEALAFLNKCEIEESVAPVLSEYLYNSFFKNAVGIFKRLDAVEQEKDISCGGFPAKYYLEQIKQTAQK